VRKTAGSMVRHVDLSPTGEVVSVWEAMRETFTSPMEFWGDECTPS
jgi:hypothetical protein